MKAASSKKFYDETAPPMLERLEELLKKNKGGDGFFVGDKVGLFVLLCFLSFGFLFCFLVCFVCLFVCLFVDWFGFFIS